MKLTDYFRHRAAIIKAAQTRTDRLDSGEADADWGTRVQDEWNMRFIEELQKLREILEPPPAVVEPPPLPKLPKE